MTGLATPDHKSAALESFVQISQSEYSTKTIGNANFESMPCDCVFRVGDKGCCGSRSRCINRAIYMECSPELCIAGEKCRNQRMQKRRCADVNLVRTDKKGFGLYAENSIKKGAFVVEYVGEVISKEEFANRSEEYAAEGCRHVYFMRLQGDEVIDAQKRGGIARFVNHSCNPNCQTQKWVVGGKVRVGIFAIRAIAEKEEITFDYQFEYFGDEGQQCFCGEPNCTGTIGKQRKPGSPVSDASLFVRKKHNEYIYSPLSEDDVPLLVRSLMSDDVGVLILLNCLLVSDRQVVCNFIRLYGVKALSLHFRNILLEHSEENNEHVKVILNVLLNLPLAERNTIVNNKLDDIVKSKCSCIPNKDIACLCTRLLDSWSHLPMRYKIPKRQRPTTPPPCLIPRTPPSPKRTCPHTPL